MGEADFPPPPLAASSAVHRNGFSSSLRFFGVLKQPDSGTNPNPDLPHDNHLLELDESDVVWSAAAFSDVPDSPIGPNSPASTDSGSSFSASGIPPERHECGQHRRPFAPSKFGLSAALAEEPGPLVQRWKPVVEPSVSATSAARAVAVPRSGAGEGKEEPVKPFRQSAPVNVPVWPRKGPKDLDRVEEWGEVWGEAAEEDEDDGEMLPPHLIVARSHVMTFSVFEGVGRTLKGRDLRRVRNAVWQKTGFLD